MGEKISPEVRSRMMSSIRGKNTLPERTVRSMLHKLGFRFRLHARLPGRPDIVLPRYKLAIMVHGCFWHRHAHCRFATSPKSNTSFWQAKFADNVRRDASAIADLRKAGWRTLIVWECCLKVEPARRRLPEALRRAVLGGAIGAEIPRASKGRLTRSEGLP